MFLVLGIDCRLCNLPLLYLTVPFVIFPSTFAGGFTFNDTRNQSPTEDTQNATELPQNKIDDDVDDEENEDISKNDEQTGVYKFEPVDKKEKKTKRIKKTKDGNRS